MPEGYFIGFGDKTTCGGTVINGDPRVTMFKLHHACEGDYVTCGKHPGTYQILGGISHIESHDRLMAGTLDSFSSCPCQARFIPSVYTVTYDNEGYEPPVTGRAAEPAPVIKARPPAAPNQPTYKLPSNWTPSAFDSLQGQEPGFYIVPKSTTREALEATLFPTPDPAVMAKFQALNPRKSHFKASSLIVLSDPNNTACIRQEAQLMQAAQQVDSSLDTLTPEEADFMHRYGAEIAGFIGHTSTWLGVSSVVMETHLTNLRDTLKAIERLHQESYRQHGHLRSPQFFAERQRLLAQLDAHLLNSTRVRGQTTLGDHHKLKTALGISSQSLVHHWDRTGGAGQIPGYSAHVDAISRAAKYMKTGGYIGIGIGGVSSLLAVQQVCNVDSAAACEKVKFSEVGKFGGATIGGALGGGVAKFASAPVFLALGVSTGIGGIICIAAVIGTGALVGTTVGAMGGEIGGEILYGNTIP